MGTKLVLDLPTDRITFTGLDRVRAERIAECVRSRLGVRGPVRVPGERTRNEATALLRASVGKAQAVLGTPAFPRIADMLEHGEEIGPGLVGSLRSTPGVLVATDRRLIFASMDPRRPVEEWSYGELEAVEVVPTVKWSVVSIRTKDEPAAVTTTSKARATAVADHVEPLIADDGRAKRFRRREETAAPERIDVNAADDGTLRGLGLTQDEAERAVRLREERGRFSSVDDFIASLELPPHEAVRVREHASPVSSADPEPAPREAEKAKPHEPSEPGDWNLA